MRLDLDSVRTHDPRTVDDEPHDAGVVIPVIDRPEGHFLVFTKRADDLDEHPGQMAFPGGGREPHDADILTTALREAKEEIGLDPDQASVIGRLDDIRTITRYAVTPIVATVPDRVYHPNEDEVAEVVVLPLGGITDPANYAFERRDHPYYGEVTIHYFHVEGYTIWGATGRIVAQLLALATDWQASEGIDEARQ